MGVRVYFESENISWACEVAYFKNEDIFDACTDALEAKAKSEGYILTESVEEEETCVTITFDEPDPEDEKPNTYHFNSEAEANAFLMGVDVTEGRTIKEKRAYCT